MKSPKSILVAPLLMACLKAEKDIHAKAKCNLSVCVCVSVDAVSHLITKFSLFSFISHIFHKTCVDPWLLEHRTCPMCKCDILKALGIEVNVAISFL
jgi:hypothetical protein